MDMLAVAMLKRWLNLAQVIAQFLFIQFFNKYKQIII